MSAQILACESVEMKTLKGGERMVKYANGLVQRESVDYKALLRVVHA